MILGIGTDIVHIKRIEDIYNKFGERFLKKNYHDIEIKDFQKLNAKKAINFLAKRFAAKEAVAKAFGVGIGKIGFKNILISSNKFGAPKVNILGNFVQYANTYDIHISISDDYPVALAFAVISTRGAKHTPVI